MNNYKLLFLSILLCGCIFYTNSVAYAKTNEQAEGVGTYVVVAGDTLYGISERFGVSVDILIEVNELSENGMIWLGQELLIPGDTYTMSQLGAYDTETAKAKPGDTVATLAIRLNQPPELIASLNAISETVRLFPGQPVKVPIVDQQFEPMRFGAIEAIDFPEKVTQGLTGRLVIQSSRPVEVQGTWGGMDLLFHEMDSEIPHQFALMPVSPMLASASYPIQLSYMTSSGYPVTRTWYIEVADGNYPSQEILVTPEIGALLDPTIIGPEIELLDSIWNKTTPDLYWTTAFSLPLPIGYQSTSPFGVRRSYNGGPYDSFHTGQDYGAPLNTPIIAPADGVVVLAQELEIRGKVVILDHGSGIYTGYWHMRKVDVEEGQEVSVGEQLGLVGSTGLSTGAHLHWEMRIRGVAVAPVQFLEDPIMPSITQ